MNEYLIRNYYEYDNAFYKYGANVSCWEQMKYQSIRNYNMDYFLVFCDDINIKFWTDGRSNFISTNDLGYNDKLFTYHCITEKAEEAEKSIKKILNLEKIVVFRTAMDYLHTSCWYHANEPYVRFKHNSIIIGENEDFYFYVDSPPMRNKQYFVPYHNNPAVGCIPRAELLESFKYKCQIGYIDINEEYLNCIADVNQILNGIKFNFFTSANKDILVGRIAMQSIVKSLKNNNGVETLLADSFIFELISSRHKKLKINMECYKELIKVENYAYCIKILNILIDKWTIIENLVIKYGIAHQENTILSIINLLEQNIIPLTEEFVNII